MNKKSIRVSDAIPDMPASFDHAVERTLANIYRQTKTAEEKPTRSRSAANTSAPKRFSKIAAYAAAAVLLIAVFAIGAVVMKNALFGRTKTPEQLAEAETPLEPTAETLDARVPAIRYHGMVYRISEGGQTYDGEVYESEILLTTEEPAPLSEWPEKEGQANFGALSMPYAMTAYGLVVEIDGAWKLFEPLLPDVDKGLFEAAYAQVLLEKYTLDRETARLIHLGEDPTEEMDTSDYFIHQRLVRLWWICDSYDSAVSVEQTSAEVRLSEIAYAENVNSLYFAFAAPHNIAFDTEPVIRVNGTPYGVIDDSGFFNLTETQTEHYAFYSIQPGVLSGEKITITFGDARFCFRYDAVKKTVTLPKDDAEFAAWFGEPTEEPTGTAQCVMFENTRYFLTDRAYAGEPRDGEVVATVEKIVSDPTAMNHLEATFGEVGMPIARTSDGLFILYDNAWRELWPITEFDDSEPISDALCLFFDGCLNYAPYENWVWSDHDDGLAADGMSFLWQIEEVKDKIPTIYNPAMLTVTAGDGVNLESTVNIYDEALNTVAFGVSISTVSAKTLDPGTYYVSQHVSRREEGKTSGYQCVVRVVIGGVSGASSPASSEDERNPKHIPMICYHGEVYGMHSEERPDAPGENATFGTVTSVISISEIPERDEQANFGSVGMRFAVTDGGLVVWYNNEWRLFVAIEFGHEG